MVLRQERYELDVHTIRDPNPTETRLFSALSRSYEIQRVQPAGGNPYAVFLVSESESLTYHYELDLTRPDDPRDPRISHALTVSRDPQGNPQQSVAVAYPRRTLFDDAGLSPGDVTRVRTAQAELHVVYTGTRYTPDATTHTSLLADAPLAQYRRGTVCEVSTNELTGFELAADEYVDLGFLRRCSLSARYSSPAGTDAVPCFRSAITSRRRAGVLKSGALDACAASSGRMI